jgi:hypothetical protein
MILDDIYFIKLELTRLDSLTRLKTQNRSTTRKFIIL